MKKMDLIQMENLNGATANSDCHDRVYGWSLGVIVGSAVGGPAALAIGGTIGLLGMLSSVAICGGSYN